MTLPVNAKTYIYAKYCFSFLGLLLFWAFSILCMIFAVILQIIPL